MPLWKALMLLNDEGKASMQSTWLWSILPRTFACDGSCNRRTDPTSMSFARASIYIRFPDKVCNRRAPQFSLDYHLRCLFPSCFCIIMICDSAQDKRCSDSSKQGCDASPKAVGEASHGMRGKAVYSSRTRSSVFMYRELEKGTMQKPESGSMTIARLIYGLGSAKYSYLFWGAVL